MVRLLEGYISCVDCSSIWGGGFSLRHMQRCRHAGKGTAAPARPRAGWQWHTGPRRPDCHASRKLNSLAYGPARRVIAVQLCRAERGIYCGVVAAAPACLSSACVGVGPA